MGSAGVGINMKWKVVADDLTESSMQRAGSSTIISVIAGLESVRVATDGCCCRGMEDCDAEGRGACVGFAESVVGTDAVRFLFVVVVVVGIGVGVGVGVVVIVLSTGSMGSSLQVC